MWPAPVLAQAPPPELVELEWNAPAECPRLEQVHARVRQLAGSRRSSVRPRATATITRTDDGEFRLRLVVHMDNVAGERNIGARSCNDLAGAAAVGLVLLLHAAATTEPDAVDTTPNQGRAAAGGASASSATGDEPPPARGPRTIDTDTATNAGGSRPDELRTWRVLLQLPMATLGVGPVPGSNWGATMAGGVSYERWRMLAGGTAWLQRHASTSDGVQEYGGDIERVTGQLLLCRALLGSRLELAPCAGAYVHHMWVRGTGAHITARTAGTTWLAVGLGAEARWHATPWLAISLRAMGELQTARPRLALENVGDVEQLLFGAGTVTLGAEWVL
jgi:hypothetical protein